MNTNFIKIIIFLFAALVACKQKSISKNSLIDIKYAELESIYQTVIQAELHRDSTLGIIDKSSNTTFLDLPNFSSYFKDPEKTIQLNSKSLPNVQFYNLDSLINKKSTSQFKSRWIISLHIPFFNTEKNKSIIELTLMNFNTEFFYNRFYVLEKKNHNYEIINIRTLNSEGKVVSNDYIPNQ